MTKDGVIYGMKADHELLALSIQDPQVFASIVHRYEKAFIRKALTIINNEEDARDIVQETFVKIYINAKKYEARESAAFSSWAYKILMNTCHTHYKKHKREWQNVSFDESIAGEAGEVEESRRERFLRIISKVPLKFSHILRQLVIEGRASTDIARDEGVSEATMRVRIHRAKSEFKKVLAQNPNL